MTCLFDYAKNIIFAISRRYEADFKKESIQHWCKELQGFSKEELDRAHQLFKGEYESLPYRFSVSQALIKQLNPTLTIATVKERLNASLRSDNRYEFLKRISPDLLKIAESANLFDPRLSTKELGYTVHSIAEQFIEFNQNKKKGFIQEEPKRLLTHDKPLLERKENPFKGLSKKEAAEKAKALLNSKKPGLKALPGG